MIRHDDAALRRAVNRAGRSIEARVESSNLPGAVLGLATIDGRRCTTLYGSAQLEPMPESLNRSTYFDLASLTKVLFTLPALLTHSRAGRLDLDEPLSTYVPDLRLHELGALERTLTPRQCLNHETHLPAVEPLYTLGLDCQTLEAYLLQRAWTAGPPVYSDINFMLLGVLLSRLSGIPLREHALNPGLTFNPPPEQCAATEFCWWRRRMLRGEVHDENAYAFGGVAGHAGLFGTVDGVLGFGEAVLQAQLDRDHLFHPIYTDAQGSRALGLETSSPGWSGGALTSHRSFGHTGFTGTGVWIDPGLGVAWALLTNRVHPTRHAPSVLPSLRVEVGETIVSSLRAHAAG